ncbi:S15/NS1 RNA-binding [Penicillium atrosanguineum]|uniref:S15/NS1 RNA-binding n=1 Tax=Penicillium atrosanguineum TaxID=1132637 RepID=A0A9W9GYU4_9EURO|nr:S15/NS1 RNA-binding [Penicillium atrosanguineum]KAJ5141525.1 S15/NS1 RNA-binding [Penicillium atrosanguineum]KAJ5308081.1 S15/NS1 RNA-binding [Penicillium atrosanguineum]
MPPRFSVQPSWKVLTGTLSRQALSNGTTITARAASTKAKSPKKHDFFMIAHARQRKAANLSRRKVLEAEREASLGHPVESKPTPFIQEIQSIQAGTQAPVSSIDINYYLKLDELNSALQFSKDLTEPLKNPDRDTADPQQESEAAELHQQQHRNAEEAIQRIVNLSNGNTKDRLRLNVQKCIDQFGRHNTDSSLPPKPAGVRHESAPVHPEKAPRIGQDTGSPEVQAAILTAKIVNLSRHLKTTNKDKHNKRNLQLLVHKRQKLLQYLRRKDRGGPRWQNLMETLGLSEAAWKGEIAI